MKKIKLFTIIIISCLITCSAFSEIKINNKSGIVFGLKSEFDIASYTSSKGGIDINYKDNVFKIGPTATFYHNIGLNFLAINGSILYTSDKIDIKNDLSLTNIISDDYVNLRNHYINIPINFEYIVNFLFCKASIYAGPYTKLLIKSEGLTLGNDLKIESDELKSLKKNSEVGLNIGAGFQLHFIKVNINYGYKLTNNYSFRQSIYKDLLNSKKGSFSVGFVLYFD